MLFSYELRTKIEYISSKQQPFFSGISHTTTHSKAQYGQSEKLQLFCQSYCFEWRSRALNNQQITFHFETISINFNAWLPSENLILNLLVETFIRLEYCHAVFYRVIISCKVNIVLSQEQQYIDMFSALKWINSGHGKGIFLQLLFMVFSLLYCSDPFQREEVVSLLLGEQQKRDDFLKRQGWRCCIDFFYTY